VDGRRQTWSEGLHTIHYNYSLRDASWILKLLMAILYVWFCPFTIFMILASFVRVHVMRLSKLP
jgi:hypothetical protein